MLRSDARQAYEGYSARTSENVRQLSFAALAGVWLFRPDQQSLALPTSLLCAGALATLALTLDFLQSFYGTIAWGWFHRTKEVAKVDNTTEFKAPRQINWPTNFFFYAKCVALLACYGFLLHHLYRITVASDR